MNANQRLTPSLNCNILNRARLNRSLLHSSRLKKAAATLAVAAMVCGWPNAAQGDHEAEAVLETVQHGQNQMHHVGRGYLVDHVVSDQGQIDVGDSIRGINIWEQVNVHPLSPAGLNFGWGVELTSVFQVQVTDKQEVGPGEYAFTFGPDPSFAEAQALGLGGQAMMIFHEDNRNNGAFDYTHDINVNVLHPIDDGTDVVGPSPQDVGDPDSDVHESILIDTGTDGNYFWALGFSGDMLDDAARPGEGEGWTSRDGMADSVLPFFNVNRDDEIDAFDFSLARLDSPTHTGVGDGLPVNGGQVSQFNSSYNVAFNGSQSWSGVQNRATPFEIATRGQLDFALVPVPPAAAMALVLLAGLGGIRQWQQRRAARPA